MSKHTEKRVQNRHRTASRVRTERSMRHFINWMRGQVAGFHAIVAADTFEPFVIEKLSNQQRRRFNSVMRGGRLQTLDALRAAVGVGWIEEWRAQYDARPKRTFQPFTGKRQAKFTAACQTAGIRAERKKQLAAERRAWVEREEAKSLSITLPDAALA